VPKGLNRMSRLLGSGERALAELTPAELAALEQLKGPNSPLPLGEADLVVVENAWQFGRRTTSGEMGQIIDKLVGAGYKEIHVSVGAHGTAEGVVEASAAVLADDMDVIGARQLLYHGKASIIPYNLANSAEQAAFYEIQGATATGELADVASLHSPCFSSVCTPRTSPAYLPPDMPLDEGVTWRDPADALNLVGARIKAPIDLGDLRFVHPNNEASFVAGRASIEGNTLLLDNATVELGPGGLRVASDLSNYAAEQGAEYVRFRISESTSYGPATYDFTVPATLRGVAGADAALYRAQQAWISIFRGPYK
jgi:hypothetical protein